MLAIKNHGDFGRWDLLRLSTLENAQEYCLEILRQQKGLL